MGSYGAFGRNIYENSITCRNILTDPQNTIELIQRHRQQASNIYRYFFKKELFQYISSKKKNIYS